MPGNVTSALDRLDQVNAATAPDDILRELAEAVDLDLLCRLDLYRAIRRGPGGSGGEGVRRPLELAERAAASGWAPKTSPAALRDRLNALAGELRDAGSWARDEPLWWEPLPEPGLVEGLWRRLDGTLPPAGGLEEAFAERRWLRLDPWLPAGWIGELHAGLEEAFAAGSLPLEQAGVGASGELSVHRSDAVAYFTGRERELDAASGALATLVQWARERLADHLDGALRSLLGRSVFSPQQAMLARYPAPSGGYAAHFDNPGGERDNGRVLTLVLYLNGPGRESRGGEIALWDPGAETSADPALVAPATGGTAVLFDARAVAHQVRPVEDGPARWALTLWLNDAPQAPTPIVPVPELTPTDALLGVAEPSLPPGTVLFHELDDATAVGRIQALDTGRARPRAGLVTTVYRGGAELDAWCAHHLGLGFDHVVLIFDHLEEAKEAADAERLRASYPDDRLTIWSGTATAERWPVEDPRLVDALRFARTGSSSHAVAGRQTLNASVALEAARSRESGGAALDWLLHLDADELFYLEGPARGGATLHEHFAAVDAAGLVLVRYLDHELLATAAASGADFPGRFKLNPRLAAARLGPRGWAAMVKALKMGQTDPRPYFNGYFNGKSAVRVNAAAAAAGVHGWFLAEGVDPSRSCFLAGPSVLHRHFASARSFRKKYLDIAGSPLPPGPRLFELCPAEEAALELIRSQRASGAGEAAVERRLDELHRRLTRFSARDVELLEQAGLILDPELGAGHDA